MLDSLCAGSTRMGSHKKRRSKVCCICKKLKPAEDFSPYGKACKPCDELRTTRKIRWCEGCMTWHEIDRFPASKDRRWGVAMRCVDWYLAHPGSGHPGTRATGTSGACCLCGAEGFDDVESKRAHYKAEHPDRAVQWRDGFMPARRAA